MSNELSHFDFKSNFNTYFNVFQKYSSTVHLLTMNHLMDKFLSQFFHFYIAYSFTFINSWKCVGCLMRLSPSIYRFFHWTLYVRIQNIIFYPHLQRYIKKIHYIFRLNRKYILNKKLCIICISRYGTQQQNFVFFSR